ncbi:hypothetical protein AMTRI_Chr12g239600 [Amborella trichopoda]|uniref:NPH3 domain-containing protein n=1 Tax=Amborella trichopoda TaxID=13333 RepID=U5DBA9_AMBTC|nr:BTB/POZ domain-containing protein NPY1 [Amborella trichopoda]ERN18707.1 hypothetical protein AMTR_s00065p00211770 [Amborella trichopoda]|eukprot:XP_006857240.1 BTB/POZ domain-containing protein NPY1 [Amborella trichopoda]
MKFMKLGSKPDCFRGDGNNTRYVASELATDITIFVEEVKFYLHKFPLLSKSGLLQKLVSKANKENIDEVRLFDFPGGPKAFEICAKFCYGMIVTLNAYNVVAARCAADHLEMTETIERGNLNYKIEVFLSSSIFRSWKDSILVLQTTKSLLPWSEDLKIIGRCIDSIASKTSVDPSKVDWSYTCKWRNSENPVENVAGFRQGVKSAPKDWWVEDICELDVELYKRVMVAVKSKGRMSGDLIGEALRAYVLRWMPDAVKLAPPNSNDFEGFSSKNRALIETIVWLLPTDKMKGCSCSFLLKLLKVAIMVETSEDSRQELVKRIGLRLNEASVNDLLIPWVGSEGKIVYDVDLVQSLVDRFSVREQGSQGSDSSETKKSGLIVDRGHGSWIEVGKVIDGYLAEIARDPNLPLFKFVNLSTAVPADARPVHDGLYRAIDIYLKEHPGLTKGEKKKICSLMDVKKLSMEACVHAAQNERLPLRVVVQVLFFEQVRVSNAGLTTLVENPNECGSHESSQSATNTDEEWDHTINELKPPKQDLGFAAKIGSGKKKSKVKVGALLPSRSRRIFDRIWPSKGETRSSETSGSSQSPTSVNPIEVKSTTGSRNRRHSVS